jgi:iron complex transport system ATP-binding protein
MTSLLECHALTYSIGRQALVRDVSFEVHPGEVLAVVGANGAGKSTLIRLLSGDLPPSGGTVTVGGRPLGSHRARDLARLRAVLPQRSTIEFAFAVEDVVRMGRSPHHDSPFVRRRTMRSNANDAAESAIVADCLRRAGIAHLAKRTFPSLSGGEQARACFARVLAQDTPLVLLDEPTAALDIRYQHLVLAEARRLASQGRAVVAVLHDLNLAAAYASRMAVMHHGALAAIGAPADVLTAELLSCAYDHPVDVLRDPRTGLPLVIPRPGAVPASDLEEDADCEPDRGRHAADDEQLERASQRPPRYQHALEVSHRE